MAGLSFPLHTRQSNSEEERECQSKLQRSSGLLERHSHSRVAEREAKQSRKLPRLYKDIYRNGPLAISFNCMPSKKTPGSMYRLHAHWSEPGGLDFRTYMSGITAGLELEFGQHFH